jgi:capsular polysaccharide biosynthesis protein
LELELKDYFKILKKRIWLILISMTLITSATAAVSIYLLDPVYEASTKLIVNKNLDTLSSGSQATLDLNMINMNIRLIDTYKEVIKTEAIMDLVVEQYPELNLTAGQLISKVKVSSVNNTQVMTVSVQDESYKLAARIANAVSMVFQEQIPTIMSVDNVTILNEAKLNATPAPVRPNPMLNIAIGLMLSLMLGVGISFLLEYLDDSIKSEEDVLQFLQLPTLSVIVKIEDSDLGNAPSRKSKISRGESPNASAQI